MKIKEIALLFALSPLFLIIKIIKPFIDIRFGYIKSSHLGFSINEPILYLLEKREFQTKKTLDFFGLDNISANQQVIDMLKRRLIASRLVAPIYNSVSKVSFLSSYLISFRSEQYFDIHGLVSKSPPVLQFSKTENEAGRDALRKLGIGNDEKFVCFCVRDSSYDQKVGGQSQSNINAYRNTNIKDYLLAVNYLIEQGVYVVRMGATIAMDLEIESPYYIKYAQHYRTEFLDVFLCANCYFYFGDSAGLVNVARMFKRPIALSNWIPMGLVSTHDSETIIIHKRLMDSSGNEIPLRVQLSSESIVFQTTMDYEQSGLNIIDNSEEENLDLIREMCQKLNGNWQKPENYETLQRQYWSCFRPNIIREPIHSKISYDFLLKHFGMNPQPT